MQFENKNYKDTVFRLLFNNKEHLLELYNALNSTSYSNADDLKITTLDGHTFMNMKNDVSFVLDFELNLYEHQSTICPNIPLRDLYYLAEHFLKTIPRTLTYRPEIIQIPTPRFFVFYNGRAQLRDKTVYKLSDMFAHRTDDPSVDLSVIAYNVNKGHNQDLLNACKTLKGYSIFVAKVRKYRQEAEENYDNENPIPLKNLVDKEEILKNLISDAVSKAIDECIQENVLKDFFLTYREEVIDMSYSENTVEEQLEIYGNDRYETGYGKGFENGSKKTADLFFWLNSSKRYDDIQKASSNPDFLTQLMQEYDSCHSPN